MTTEIRLGEPPRSPSGITEVAIKGFRTARDVAFAPGAMCALVGEANAGKSNLLAAIRAVLDPTNAPLTDGDAAAEVGGVAIRARLAGGGEVRLEGKPGEAVHTGGELAPQVLFLPAEARGGAVLAPSSVSVERAEGLRQVLSRQRATPAAQALALLDAVESSDFAARPGFLILIEEPELYLRPQAQRYLYRVLRELAAAGNQVIYSTHSPAFLNVARLDELVFVERLPTRGTRALQPEPVSSDEDFRVMTEFDAARSELFLAQAVVLVEGLTEKLVLPFVFSALGHDVDREAISIVECGGKPNLPLFARICRATGIPFVVVHDSDRKSSGRLAPAERALNALIAETAGADRVVVLDPDFEGVAGLVGHRRKPERAWREFAERAASQMPPELVRIVELVMSSA
ncbi:MAG TPA: TOPRIM nucleotidyl transferase/hydrolase domain-containing protein [Acidimicrobiia bacterium]|nr:TOPRIM nucleotidyl transferase/hydrolase domain-containing protein [Acidimicrobiia bacterium]